jgi:hypothetical protein
MHIPAFVIVLTFAIIVFGLMQKFGRLIINYRFTPDKMQVVLFGHLPVVSILLSNVIKAKPITFIEAIRPHFRTLQFGNRILGNLVEITYHSGLFNRILVTPDDVPTFVSEINSLSAARKV